eukprot:SAG31_NODE_5132_length_2723_cov_2.839558_1_plen_470_part_10
MPPSTRTTSESRYTVSPVRSFSATGTRSPRRLAGSAATGAGSGERFGSPSLSRSRSGLTQTAPPPSVRGRSSLRQTSQAALSSTAGRYVSPTRSTSRYVSPARSTSRYVSPIRKASLQPSPASATTSAGVAGRYVSPIRSSSSAARLARVISPARTGSPSRTTAIRYPPSITRSTASETIVNRLVEEHRANQDAILARVSSLRTVGPSTPVARGNHALPMSEPLPPGQVSSTLTSVIRENHLLREENDRLRQSQSPQPQPHSPRRRLPSRLRLPTAVARSVVTLPLSPMPAGWESLADLEREGRISRSKLTRDETSDLHERLRSGAALRSNSGTSVLDTDANASHSAFQMAPAAVHTVFESSGSDLSVSTAALSPSAATTSSSPRPSRSESAQLVPSLGGAARAPATATRIPRSLKDWDTEPEKHQSKSISDDIAPPVMVTSAGQKHGTAAVESAALAAKSVPSALQDWE